MQVILSLLNLQLNTAENPAVQQALTESITRLRSMAFVHEMLYKSINLAKINMMDYIKTLLKYLFSTYNVAKNQIETVIEVDDISLGVDKAIPCGLIINELNSNTFKYAFPDNRQGKIMVLLKKNNQDIILTVSDDGIGTSLKIDLKSSQTLGVKLIHALVKQLNGTIAINSNQGYHFMIHFPG